MKALVGAFNQEKALVGAFSVITNLRICFGWNFLKHKPGEVAADEAGEHVEVDGDAAAVERLVGPEDEDGEQEAQQGQAVAGVPQQQDVRPRQEENEYRCNVLHSSHHTHTHVDYIFHFFHPSLYS